MPLPTPSGTPAESGRGINRKRIRNNILVLMSLVLLIALQIAFLTNYSGFQGWQRIDSDLLIFVAVNVNVVLLTAVFYMILRNVFKLAYESRSSLAGFSLKTKLMVAFMALAIPSTAFHLTASGFIAKLFDTWTVGEYRQVLENARVVRGPLDAMEHSALERTAARILSQLPGERARFLTGDWPEGFHPDLNGGVFIYGGDNQLLSQWFSRPRYKKLWNDPPSEYFMESEGFYWIERSGKQQVRRLLFPVEDLEPGYKMEVLSVTPRALSQAIMALEYKEANRRVIGRDLILLVLTILIGITLLIIFAATWISFYLARGFARPVELLSDATRRVSQGELGYQVEESHLGPLQRDFAGLVGSFNRMSRQLKEQRLQLTETAESLRSSHEELGERNRFVELLLENLNVGIISLNNSGNLTTVNRWAFRMLQLSREHYLSRHYRVVLGRELVALLDDMVERVRDTPRRWATRNLTLTVNRKTVHVEVTVLPLQKEEGGTQGFVVMLEDVTDLQRTQRALAWREVARRVAHEIKNPLTPITLSAQRIRRKYLPGLAEDGVVLDHCTQTIIDQVASLKTMVNEFSQFAQLPESRPVPADLNDIVREVARFYESGLPDGVQLILDLDESLPELPLDSEQIKRVFTNLIDNAAASITGEGSVTIRTAYPSDQQFVLAEIIDDGSGVPDEVRSTLFEPYTSTKEGGTGLGLPIVNQIVSDHNGFVRYSDRKPNGSIFSLEFRTR